MTTINPLSFLNLEVVPVPCLSFILYSGFLAGSLARNPAQYSFGIFFGSQVFKTFLTREVKWLRWLVDEGIFAFWSVRGN